MQQVSCPGCGAPIQFKSSASVLAVCEFCRTTVLKDAQSVINLGKMSEVLEDYSPLKIGTSGEFQGRTFSLIGRLQLQYSDGFWNEWYLLFDDGTSGWLSDASGQLTMTSVQNGVAQLPRFEQLQPGRTATLFGQIFTASDVRTARCTAGQGELPFKVGQGYVARVADFRAGDRFLTLDYSDEGGIRAYLGQSVELATLKPQLLRDATEITDSAGHFRGKVSALTCPSCGAAVNCVPGVTVHIICPSCHAAVDTAGAVATVLAAAQSVERQHFTLELGSQATIAGSRYTLLGEMRRSDGQSTWSEYLLYSPGKPFIWLLETSDGWQRAEVLDRWPIWVDKNHVKLDQQDFRKTGEYSARVLFAAGSFNWRVQAGATVLVTEFVNGPQSLAAEVSREEMTWSRSTAVPLDQVRAWFGKEIHAESQPSPGYKVMARRVLIPMFAVNLIPLLLAGGAPVAYIVLAALAIYLPAYFLDNTADRKS
jgi:hypothetical protein